MDLMRIEGLCKTYGKGENEVKALDNVSFTVPKGQMLAVIGPSGSGKSTLLHILGGVDRPTAGKVFLDEQDVFAQDNKNLAIFRRRQVGLIYQFYNLIPVLDAEENITLPLIMDGRKPDSKHLDELLDLLQLKERRHHLPSQLSGGQQQRVSIGRALFTSPGVILADEPTGNLDSRNSAEIMKLLQKSNKEYDQTMIIITHDENIALQCDRIITLSDGKIVSDKLNTRK
ncbi:MAG: ABC transporter ATP-binding protein [Ruminococcus sp.]|nr:ABC transporter ATP-binding protein [Ruminococcus sp.]